MLQMSEGDRPKLLFVDDEFRVLVSLKSIFRTHYDVRTVTSGAQALDVLKDWPADVIISDQRMPVMTGVEVLKEAAQIRPIATRVLLTGYSDLEAILGSINESEIFRFVSKPWKRAELCETIDAAVRKARDAEADVNAAGEPRSVVAQSTVEVSGDEAGVLVLEPNSDDRAQMLQALNGARPVHAAGSVGEALGLLEKERIGTVITASIVDGEVVTSLVNGLRQMRPDLVYIVITRQPDAQHIIDLINYGQVYRVLRKPLNTGLLRGAVNMAARRHEMLQDRPDQARRITLELAPLPPERKSEGMFAKIRQFLRG